MTKYYVLLTGSKNNAGDFLIRQRASELLGWIRPDRSLIHLNAWEPLTDEQLETVNASAALLLTGGPSLQMHMYPNTYRLRPRLEQIKVPLVAMGIGWKSASGTWQDSRTYRLSPATCTLLERISSSGCISSVRDFHTLNVLQHRGLHNFVMTGCPALYSRDHVGFAAPVPSAPKKVSFSLGVSFLNSRKMQLQMQQIITLLLQNYGQENLTVVFHHSIDNRFLQQTKSSVRLQLGRKRFLHGQRRFLTWLQHNNVRYADISGGVEAMLQHYATCDLHVGYRVHAHILMASWSKPSFLIAEDGRARALRSVLGGPILDGYNRTITGPFYDISKKLKITEPYDVSSRVPEEVVACIAHEQRTAHAGMQQARAAIDIRFNTMQDYLRQLP